MLLLLWQLLPRVSMKFVMTASTSFPLVLMAAFLKLGAAEISLNLGTNAWMVENAAQGIQASQIGIIVTTSCIIQQSDFYFFWKSTFHSGLGRGKTYFRNVKTNNIPLNLAYLWGLTKKKYYRTAFGGFFFYFLAVDYFLPNMGFWKKSWKYEIRFYPAIRTYAL